VGSPEKSTLRGFERLRTKLADFFNSLLEDARYAGRDLFLNNRRRFALVCDHLDFDERFAGPTGNLNFQGSLFLAAYDQIVQRHANRITSCSGVGGILMRYGAIRGYTFSDEVLQDGYAFISNRSI